MEQTTTVRPRLATPTFVTVVSAALAYFFAQGVLVPAVPRYVAGPLHGSDAAVGVVIGAFSVCALLLRPWAGRLADRRGRARLMIVGAAVVAVSVAGYAVASSVAVLFAMRLLTGVGEALFFVAVLTAVGDLAPPERRGEGMSWASLSLYVGLALGPPVGEWVIDRYGYPAAWSVAAGAAVAALLLALRVGETRPAEAIRAAGRGASAADAVTTGPARQRRRFRLLHPAAVVPALMLLSAVWGMAGLLAFAPLYARDLGLPNAGLVLFGFAGIVVLIRSVGARLPDRLGPARATISALAAVTAGLTLIGLWRTPVGLYAGAAVLAVGVALATPSIMALAWQAAPAAERGAATGTVAMAIDVALGFGPAALGLVASRVGRPDSFLAAAVVGGLGLLLAVRSARLRLRVARREPVAVAD